MRLLLTGLFMALVLAVPFLIWGNLFSGNVNRELLTAYGGWPWLGGIVLLTVDILLPMPATVVMSALGAIYGPFIGGAAAAAARKPYIAVGFPHHTDGGLYECALLLPRRGGV